jgi:hypothetical protein
VQTVPVAQAQSLVEALTNLEARDNQLVGVGENKEI